MNLFLFLFFPSLPGHFVPNLLHVPSYNMRYTYINMLLLFTKNNTYIYIDHTVTTPPIGIPYHTSSIALIHSPIFEEMNKKFTESKTLKSYSFTQLPIGKQAISQRPCLSPILGSFDYSDAATDLNEKIKKELNMPSRIYNVSATNELPLTELNLDLFTSANDNQFGELQKDSVSSSTNELPLSDIKFKSYDDNLTPVLSVADDLVPVLPLPLRSYSDPNILEIDSDEKIEKFEKIFTYDQLSSSHSPSPCFCNEEYEIKPYFPPIDSPSFPLNQDNHNLSLNLSPQRSLSQPNHLSPVGVENACYPFPFSFYPHPHPHDVNSKRHYSMNAPPSRSASQPSKLSASVCHDEPNPRPHQSTDILSPSNSDSVSVTNPKVCPPARSLSHPNDLTPHSSPTHTHPHSHPHPHPHPTARPPPVLTNPSAVNPESSASASARRHRHGIAGQMSYIKMLGFGFGGPLGLKKLAGGSSNSLFSTAVISGSSSAPNLRDMISSTASASVIEGFGGVPPIRPLETLHNALSLRQLDTFLDKMTSAQLFRTPASSPPKYPSTPLPTPTSSSQISSITNAMQANHPPPLRLQSPSNSLGWSGPPSFVSSSGASSPTELSGLCSRESSDMSASLISSDGVNVGAICQMFPTVPGLDQDLGSVGILLEHETQTPADDSMEIAEFYSPTTGRLHVQGDSGDITPVSGCSELDCNTTDATAGSTADADVTMTEDFDASEEDVLGDRTTPLQECLSDSQHTSLFAVGDTRNKNNSKEQLVLERLSNVNDSPQNVSHDNINKLSNNLNISSKNEATHLKHIENAKRVQHQPSTSSRSQYDSEGNLHKNYARIYSCPQSPSVSSDSNKNSSANVKLYEKDYAESSKNISSLGSDKKTTKEKFCDSNRSENKISNKSNQFNLMNEVFDKKLIDVAKNLNIDETKPKVEKALSNELQLHPKVGATGGTVVVKESFIEPPRMTRISKSFHGKTATSSTLNVETAPRRASDSVTNQTHSLKNTFPNKPKSSESDKNKSVNVQRQLMTQLSQPCGSSSMLPAPVRKSSLSEKGSRFRTTLVDEAEHAASVLQNPARIQPNANSNVDNSPATTQSSSKTQNLDNSNLKK